MSSNTVSPSEKVMAFDVPERSFTETSNGYGASVLLKRRLHREIWSNKVEVLWITNAVLTELYEVICSF